jgi:hypothetical protein
VENERFVNSDLTASYNVVVMEDGGEEDDDAMAGGTLLIFIYGAASELPDQLFHQQALVCGLCAFLVND